ncbi:hypothetical protein FQN60_008505 [Etheostoma spectabile]|uniref:Neuregulin C-terminal domain-containing protein n=2 Tax=Etheostoma spectabile TaxID=54343 RepID=A0A5J5CVW2_9PERO|nr:hypothetical protein FQN60_008505 [Etheostoma spectabile]
MSAPLSSLAISVPSVGLSPSGEEERPLLLSNSHQPRKSSNRDEQKRISAHYNHGHVAHSLPPSPLFPNGNGYYQSIGDHDTTAGSQMFTASPEKLLTNNNINSCSTKPVPNGHVVHSAESGGDSMVSETDAPQEEHTSFCTTDSTASLLLGALDSSRTNPASLNDHLQDTSRSIPTTKLNPVAV